MAALMLLSAEEKRRFFQRMEAFLATNNKHCASPRCIERGCSRDAVPRHATPSSTATCVMTHEPVGQGEVGEQAHNLGSDERFAIVIPEDDNSDENSGMARTLPSRKRPEPATTTPLSTPSPNTKRKKARRASSLDPQEQLLRGKRVLLVPVGVDVSRKRLEIWQDMVYALGGDVVAQPTSHKTNQRHLLHLVSNGPDKSRQLPNGQQAAAQVPSTGKTLTRRRSGRVDWDQVDIVVASAQVDAKRLQAHYQCDSVPSHIKLYTPEWLAYIRQEKVAPSNEAEFEWGYQHHLQKHQRQQEAEMVSTAVHEGDDDGYESGNQDGSDGKKESSKEIVRAPPVEIDTEQFRLEEEELKAKKEKLVSERRRIFQELNPRFESLSRNQPGKTLKMEAFVCQKSSLMQANLNAHLTGPLEELMEFLHVERDIWREYSYKKIVSSLKAMRTRVSTVRDLKGLWWAKGRMRDKVVEILETGKLEKLEAKKTNPRLRSLAEMARIWGVGPATAAKLYNMGYKTLDALRQSPEEVLNFQQQIGLKRYHDFLTKIPRAEVQQIEKTVVDEVHRIIPNATALACGSYRRGKPSSGDCDVLITDPDSDECDILPELLRRLHESGFLTDDLTHVSDHRMGHCDSYMGVCQVRKDLPHRRLDIKVYPRRYFGFALLYFTGSDHFNRSMRLFARKKGWSLSDRSLKRVIRIRKGEKIESGESVICPNEVDVFIALGLEYKDPSERNCFDIRFLEEDEASAKRRGAKRSTDADDIAVAAEDGAHVADGDRS